MNVDQAQWLLTQIEALSGQQWPRGAAEAWADLLVKTDVDDALQAVHEWYDQAEPASTRITPGYIRRRAGVIAENRGRAQRRALGPATPTGSDGQPVTPPNATYLRARAQLARKLDMNRALADSSAA